ncbi:hypothetical protein [Kitasatospora sp. NPDC088346]|uniref:hypothetical protein n=1 Tax=Kitasatospora sp. NPDC088346 TaxID=3364073 RepID=UPI0037FC1EEF
MPFTDTALQDEFTAAVEWVADRVLGALTGAGGIGVPGDALGTDHHPHVPAAPATAAALRVIGPDLFAPELLAGKPLDTSTAAALAAAGHAFDAFRPPGDGREELVVGWRDWAGAELLHAAGRDDVPVHRPAALPWGRDDNPPGGPGDWPAWSVPMSQLSCLALPGLDSAVHESARRSPLALARGTTRSLLRRDHRVAARLVRWLAWVQTTGTPVPIEVAPVVRHLALVGGGGSRTALDLEIARRLLAEEPSP